MSGWSNVGRALRHRNYRLFFAGQGISLIGTWLTRFAMALYTFDLTHSPWMLGLATSGIVLSTIRQAMDLDYQCTVVHDCCADLDDEVHRVLVEKVFAKHNKIVAAAELAAAL